MESGQPGLALPGIRKWFSYRRKILNTMAAKDGSAISLILKVHIQKWFLWKKISYTSIDQRKANIFLPINETKILIEFDAEQTNPVDMQRLVGKLFSIVLKIMLKSIKGYLISSPSIFNRKWNRYTIQHLFQPPWKSTSNYAQQGYLLSLNGHCPSQPYSPT